MAVAQGICPSCGAPIEFGVGSSIAKVCSYCAATVLRTDRGLENLGKVAAIANTPSLIAVGDQGRLRGRTFVVLGRVQLDHGRGPWDEYYVSYDQGREWGWLAYAQGRWHATQIAPGEQGPPHSALTLEMDVTLGGMHFRVVEIKTGRVVSAEGELPSPELPGSDRYYADCYGRENGFATLDYGSDRSRCHVYLGWALDEAELEVTELGPRSVAKVKSDMIRCPNCGGDVPKLSGDRARRLGCSYCGAVSDIATAEVVAKQDAAREALDIPLGSQGTWGGYRFVVTAYVRRSTRQERRRYTWEEYLLWTQPVGYRWLVKDPESGWSWVQAANPAEIDRRGAPHRLAWGGRQFTVRNQAIARVDYVLGEVYWQCEVGETAAVADYANGKDVLSREEGNGEVHYSYSTPLSWRAIAETFGLPVTGPGAVTARQQQGGRASDDDDDDDDSDEDEGTPGGGIAWHLIALLVVALVLLMCVFGTCGSCIGVPGIGPGIGLGAPRGDSRTSRGGGSYRGRGVFSGGK